MLIFAVVGLRFGSLGFVAPLEQIFFDISGYLQEGAAAPLKWGQGIWRSYIALQGVRVENEALRREIQRLQRENVQYRKALIENARYRRLLEIKERIKAPAVAASVISVDIAPWVGTVSVDRGRKDGIGPGMAVVSGAGVVGQVIESSPHYSKILLLTDLNSSVAAVIQSNRVRGILKGTGRDGCQLAYVENDAAVQVGDAVVTSGTDGVFPKGLLLGKVISVEPGSISDLFQVIAVSPAENLNRVEEVLILTSNQTLMGNPF